MCWSYIDTCVSGSPIIQNGKLIGAVTHILIDAPTKGYGIFAENMLETARQVTEEQAYHWTFSKCLKQPVVANLLAIWLCFLNNTRGIASDSCNPFYKYKKSIKSQQNNYAWHVCLTVVCHGFNNINIPHANSTPLNNEEWLIYR